ncbi:MAG: phosphate/phosphite/phosphonate ABC transporter substrate-binding protein [Cyanobacteria bacterium P01_E01_bin.42]
MKRRNFLLYSLLFAAGCQASQSFSTSQSTLIPEKLRFSVTDVLEEEKLKRDFEVFRQALAEVLATEVEFFVADSQTATASALQLEQVDLALAGPAEYVIIRSRTNAIPVIELTRPNYRSVIVAPKSTKVQSLEALKEKAIALSDIGSTSGHLGPTKLLIDAGLDPKTDINLQMLGDDGSVKAIQDGQVEAWGGSAVDYEAFFGEQKDEFPIIAQTPLLPNDVFITTSQMKPEIIEEIRSRMFDNQDKLLAALVKGEKTQKYRDSELLPAQDSHYDMIREVYRAIGEEELL